MARDYNVPVAFTMRMVDSRQRSWMDLSTEWNPKKFIPLMKAVPDARYLLLNISTGLALNKEETDILKKTDYMFDTSGRTIDVVRDFLSLYGKERFAFGTHAPVFDYLSGMMRIAYLNEQEVSEREKEMLRSGNAKRFLNI